MRYSLIANELLDGIVAFTRVYSITNEDESIASTHLELIVSNTRVNIRVVRRCILSILKSLVTILTKEYIVRAQISTTNKYSLLIKSLAEKRMKLSSRVANGDELYRVKSAAIPTPPTVILD